MYHVRLYIVEKIGFEMAPRWCGIHSELQPLLQKTCIFHTSETLVVYARICLLTHALAHVCRLLPTYVGRGPLWSFISKNRIFAHLKVYIFHFNIPQVNVIFDWTLNWPWALEFEHHWGTGVWVVRGIKCGVYRIPSAPGALRGAMSLSVAATSHSWNSTHKTWFILIVIHGET